MVNLKTKGTILFIVGAILFSCPADARRTHNVTELNSNERQYYIRMLEAIGMPIDEVNIVLCHDLDQTATAISYPSGTIWGLLVNQAKPLFDSGLITNDNFSSTIRLIKSVCESGHNFNMLIEIILPKLHDAGLITADNISTITESVQSLGVEYLFAFELIFNLAAEGVVDKDNITKVGDQISILIKKIKSIREEAKDNSNFSEQFFGHNIFDDNLPALAKAGVVNKDNVLDVGLQIISLELHAHISSMQSDFLVKNILSESGTVAMSKEVFDMVVESTLNISLHHYHSIVKHKDWLAHLADFKEHPYGIEIAIRLHNEGFFPLEELVKPILLTDDPLSTLEEKLIVLRRLSDELKVRLPDLSNAEEVMVYYLNIFQTTPFFIDYERCKDLANSGISQEIFNEIIESVLIQIRPGKNVDPWLDQILMFNDWPFGVEVALALSKSGYLPLEALVMPILQEDHPLDVITQTIYSYDDLKRELQSRLPDLNNSLERALYFHVLIERNGGLNGLSTERYNEMLSKIEAFLSNHQDSSEPFDINGYKQFTVAGESITYTEQAEKLISDYREIVREKYSYILKLDVDSLLEDEFGNLEEPLDFYRRILAYIVLKSSDNPPKVIRNSTLTKFITGRYSPDGIDAVVEQKAKDLLENCTDPDELRRSIVEDMGFHSSYFSKAVFAVSLLNYQNATTEERRRLEYLMVEAIIAFRFDTYTAWDNLLQDSNPELVLQTLDDVYHEHSLRYVLEDLGIDIDVPKVVERKLHSRQEAVQMITLDESLLDNQVDVYTFMPVKFDAIFRGYTFMDCSKDDHFGSPYIWTLHPDNMYYLVKQNGNIIGYIGLSEARIKDTEQKVLLIDTLQFHAQRQTVVNVLDALQGQVPDKGFVGLALPKSLSAAFNSEVTRQSILSLRSYREGKTVELEYIDSDFTRMLTDKYGQDEYHSLFASNTFVLLSPNTTVNNDEE